MTPKKKGNRGEHIFSHWFQKMGLGRAMRNSMSGGSIWKGDIANDQDLCIEVKTVKRINLLDVWKQVKRDADMCHATPVAAIHFDHMPDEKWLMVMDSADFAELLRKAKGIPTPENI